MSSSHEAAGPVDDKVLDAALRLLSYRPRSEAEVRQRLSRHFSPDRIQWAIDGLRRRGLLDDAAFARFWRESRERHRPRGASAMRWELLRLGVSREVVEEALEGLDEEESAYQAASRTLASLRRLDYHTFRKRMFAYLRRRGFGSEVATRTILRLRRELSDPAYSSIEGRAHDEQPEDDTEQAGRQGQ